MIDPAIQFANAGADDEHAAQAISQTNEQIEAMQAACKQFLEAAQEVWEQIKAIVARMIEDIALIAAPFVEHLWRRILYARLSEHWPGWLVRPVVRFWPRRWLPALRRC